MRTGRLSLVLVAVVSLATACKGNDHRRAMFQPKQTNNVHVKLRLNIGLDMSKVQGFTLAPVKASSQAAPAYAPMSADCRAASAGATGTQTTGCINLFALTTTGVAPVALFDVPQQTDPAAPTGTSSPTNAATSASLVPEAIFNAGKLVLFVLHDAPSIDGLQCGMVILRKSDGALFCSKDAIGDCGPDISTCQADRILQAATDVDIIYAMRMDGSLVRFDFSNPASATATVLVDQTDGMIGPFFANAGGDALVQVAASNLTELRYYKRTNGFSKLPGLTTSGGGALGKLCTFAGPGTANTDFYVVTPPYNGTAVSAGLSSQVLKVSLDPMSQQPTYTTYASDPGNTWGLQPGMCAGYGGNTAGRHLILMTNGNSFLFEAYNPQGVPVSHPLSGFANVNRMFSCQSQVVLAGTDASGNEIVVRYDPVTTGTQTVLSSTDYTITQVDVAPNCDITFGGRRMADNARILGNIPAGTTTVNVYTNALGGDVKQLVRIR